MSAEVEHTEPVTLYDEALKLARDLVFFIERAKLTEEQVIEVLAELTSAFCEKCGRQQPKSSCRGLARGCQCWNDR